MSEVVVDLETLDLKLSAKIISIGAVKFDFDKPFDSPEVFYVEVDWMGQHNRTEDKATNDFWVSQSSDARAALNGVTQLGEALRHFAEWFDEENDVIWGNGSIFDAGILLHAYNQIGREAPWFFRNVNDYRTIKRLHRQKFNSEPQMKFEGVQHHALYDAMHEAKMLHAMWRKLKC